MSDEEEVLGEDIVGEEIGDEIDDATVNDEEDLDENYEDEILMMKKCQEQKII